MNIDIVTLFVLVVLLCSVVGSILLWAGLGDGGRVARYGAGGLYLIALGIGLVLLRGRIPDWISIVFANVSLTLGFGFLWSAARLVAGRPVWTAAVLAGPLVWIAACTIPAFYAGLPFRLLLISLIAAGYSSAAGWELWHGRQKVGHAQLALACLCYGHAILVTGRGIAALFLPPMTSPLEGNWLQNILMLEAPIALMAGCFLAVGMVREHSEGLLRRNAETDELTGVLNRRAFLGQAGECVTKADRLKRPVVLLLFDLDHFKTINDRFGHAVGDRILKIFAASAEQATRMTDVFGRVGGEEFAALLPGCDAVTGRQIAERIRTDFSLRTAAELGPAATATVSVGVASNGSDVRDLEALMLKADMALYGSKRGGRDRVTDASVADLLPGLGMLSAGHAP